MFDHIISALFTSVWDGFGEVTTPCKVNLDTREIFDIVQADVEVSGSLITEYVTINGEQFSAYQEGDKVNDEDYWYC